MAPMDYFFIDFGLSRSFPSYEKRHLVGNGGQNKTVPELSYKIPYDPVRRQVATRLVVETEIMRFYSFDYNL